MNNAKGQWTVTMQFAVGVPDQPVAESMVSDVLREMDVSVGEKLEASPAADPGGGWSIVVSLSLSDLRSIEPDDAMARFRYVTRNLPGISFARQAGARDSANVWEWVPSRPETGARQEELLHPAIRAAWISISRLQALPWSRLPPLRGYGAVALKGVPKLVDRSAGALGRAAMPAAAAVIADVDCYMSV
jgi:hypothetical protein